MSALTYPHTPGHRGVDTSIEACPAPRKARATRERIMAQLTATGPSSPDKMAELLGESILSIRPRFSELLALGRIEDTGDRDRNVSGKSCKIWRAKHAPATLS